MLDFQGDSRDFIHDGIFEYRLAEKWGCSGKLKLIQRWIYLAVLGTGHLTENNFGCLG